MRKIKFRAWDNYNKKIFYLKDLMYWKLFNDCSWHLNGEDDDFVTDSDQAELMQYTGIKDKNGKEIYEGDIIEVDKHRFEVYWDKEYVGFDFKMADKLPYCLDMDAKFMEIVGNIYENPKLLK